MTRAWLMMISLTLISGSVTLAQESAKFYLPSNPVAAAYILSRLSDAELIAAPRSEFVYVALLQRSKIDARYRQEALTGLAAIRKTDPTTELIAALAELDRKGEESERVVRELAPLLLRTNAPALRARKESLEKLVENAQLPATRQLAYAALTTASGSLDETWVRAEGAPGHLADLIRAAEWVSGPGLRDQFFTRIKALFGAGADPELTAAAISVVGRIGGREADAFKLLARLVRDGTSRAEALKALEEIPRRAWAKEEAGPMVASLIAYLEKVPATQRTEPDFVNAVQFATELAGLLPVEAAKSSSRILRGLGVPVHVVRTLPEQMLYDVSLLVVEAGKPVEILLINDDVMQHNLVVVAPGALEEVGLASEKMSPEPDAQGRLYVPDSPKVLHATKMLNPAERVRLSFVAPAVGEYTYVCTFPGHWRRMTGRLAVVTDVEAYLATNTPVAAPEFTEWKVSDLAPELGRVASASLIDGKTVFSTLACVQCHKAGADGYAYGPDLAESVQRFKGDRAALLQEIIEPSRQISERYRNYQFTFKDGETVTGMIMSETENSVTLQLGPADALIQNIPKARITGRQALPLSVMPAGLLNSMPKQRIFNLLAFLEAVGSVKPPHGTGHQH